MAIDLWALLFLLWTNALFVFCLTPLAGADFVAAGEACVRRRSRRISGMRSHPDTPRRLMLRRPRRRTQASQAATGGVVNSGNWVAKPFIHCCSLLFIVNRRSVQLFKRSCSFLFSNERLYPSPENIFHEDQ
ncbi:hypothetical protein [Pseudomonas fluorescens]|uniref:hypothetical protein n=1 Tax=Pseudomonas fluorescens TaxID=294 RepID=UPI001241F207|nr:hypothetical protein [Pseudomonas fluorescens]